MQADTMQTIPQSAKLIELRAKTDRQLTDYISHRLDAGFAFARWAQESHDRSHWASKATFETGACRAYTEAANLLPWVGSGARAELQPRLQQLRCEIAALREGAVMCA